MSTLGSVISACPVLRIADDDLEQAIRQPGLLEDRGKDGAAAHRRLRIRLEDHGIAQREGRGDDPHAQHAWRVPWRDRANDADGHAPNHAQALLDHGGDELAVGLPRHGRRGERLTGCEVLLVMHLVCDGRRSRAASKSRTRAMLLVYLCGTSQDRGAILVVRGRPCRLSFARRGGRARDVLWRRLADRQQVLARGRLAHFAFRAGAGVPIAKERVEPAVGGALGERFRRYCGHRASFGQRTAVS
jgi:hypothetical protein